MKKILLLTLLTLLSGITFSQSLSGNLNSESTRESLGYGNVDVYKNNKLVASVLTDEFGNFKVALDTGTYECVVNYVGYEPIKKTVRVEKDEKADFSIKEDPNKPKRNKSAGRDGSASGATIEKIRVTSREDESIPVKVEPMIVESHAYSDVISSPETMSGTYSWSSSSSDLGSGGKVANKGVKGALTAGEINDYSKWKLWQDLTGSELSSYEKGWNIAIKGRYTVQLQSQSGLPLADAIVKLVKNNSKVLFTSRTDNTGKAELWTTITGEEAVSSRELSIDVEYQGTTKKIKNVKPFEESINHLMLNVECREVNDVDIAFVVDATGSMGDELRYLKAEMNDIVYQSKQISSRLNFRFANVFYRDLGSHEAYTTKSMDFSRILSESVQFIEDQSAGGGGDYEEAVEIALDSAINSLSWSEEARTRLIFLILDAPPHNTEVNQKKLRELINKAAEKGIRIVPIGASGINKATEYLMRTLAIGTNGTYTFLTDHSGIGNAHIEPSTDEYKVETLNDVLVRILKSYTYMPDCEQNIPELELDYPDSLVFVNQLLDSTLLTNTNPRDSIHGSDSTDVRDSLHWNHNNNNNNQNRVSWSYYPNPTNGIINITANIDIAELYVTDLSGKLLQTIKEIKKDRIHQVDLSDYTTGIYLIRYPHEDTWISGKVVLYR